MKPSSIGESGRASNGSIAARGTAGTGRDDDGDDGDSPCRNLGPVSMKPYSPRLGS